MNEFEGNNNSQNKKFIIIIVALIVVLIVCAALFIWQQQKIEDATAEKEQAHFINIAFGSLMEVLAQMDIAKDLEYITIEDYKQIETTHT